MKRIIKKGLASNYMKRLFLFFILTSALLSTAYASNSPLVIWQFEEGGGGIALDDSGNNYNGILNDVTYTSASKFGTYATSYATSSSFVITDMGTNLPNVLTIEGFVYPNTNSNDPIFAIYDSELNFSIAYYFDANFERTFTYKDNLGGTQTRILDSTIIPNSQYYSFYFELNFTSEYGYYYRNNVLIGNFSLINIDTATNNQTIIVKMGESQDASLNLNGRLDAVHIINGALNSTARTNLFNTNTYEFTIGNETGGGGGNETPTPPVISGTSPYNLISSYSPANGTNVSYPLQISTNLYNKASCDIYANNKYVDTVANILSFTANVPEAGTGNITYFLYCYLVDANNTLLYDLTNITHVLVNEPSPSTLNFVYSSTDISVPDEPLFMVTPCLNPGIVIPFSGRSQFSMINNPDVYFAPLVNGIATFNLPAGTHNFCLINGIGQYNNPNGFSSTWYISRATHQEDIGKFSVPSNVTQNFYLTIDKTDIYDITNPQWWGVSWVDIIGSLIAVVLGGITMYIGIETKSGKIVLAGILLVALGLGYQLGNLVFGVLL